VRPRIGGTVAAAIVAMILVWGYSWVAMKVALAYAPPLDFAVLRVAVGCVILFAIVAMRGRGLALRGYGMALLVGLLQVAVFIALTNFALTFAGPGKTSVLVFTMPFWMIVFAHFILRERMRGAQWIAVALAFVGLVLIVAPWQLTSLTGSLLAIAAGAIWAITSVLSKKFPTAASDPLLFTAWQLFFGLLALLLMDAGFSTGTVRWTWQFVAALGFSGILGTAVGWWLWTYVLAKTPAGITGLNALGIPVVAVVSSALQLGERPPVLELVGMALIGGALGLLAWLGMRRAAVQPVQAT